MKKLKRKLVVVLLSVLLIAGLFTGCNGDAVEDVIDEAVTDEYVLNEDALALQAWDNELQEYLSGLSEDEKTHKELLSEYEELYDDITDHGTPTWENIPDNYDHIDAEDGSLDYHTIPEADLVEGDMSRALTGVGSEIPENYYQNHKTELERFEVLEIPKEVTKIGKNAFKGASNLKTVKIQGVPEICEGAFEGCTKLNLVKIGCVEYKTLAEMRRVYAESSNKKLTIRDRAFANCATSYRKLTIDCGLTIGPSPAVNKSDISSSAFDGVKMAVFKVSQVRMMNFSDWNWNFMFPLDPERFYFPKKAVESQKFYVQAKKWSEDLPDDELITNIGIPGTHDSATKDCSIHAATTQHLTMFAQFQLGVRWFDLRVVHTDKNDRSQMIIKHGSYSTGLTLHDAIEQVATQIRGSQDFAIIQLTHQNEKGDVCKNPNPDNYYEGWRDYCKGEVAIQDELKKYKDEGIAIDFKSNLRVKDMRGKILFVHVARNNWEEARDYEGVGPNEINTDNRNSKGREIIPTGCWGWGGFEVITDPKVIRRMWASSGTGMRRSQSSGIKESAWLQNLANPGSGQKMEVVKMMLNDYAGTGTDVWGFNYASGYRYAIPGYVTNAKQVNSPTSTYIKQSMKGKKIGFIIMDFAGDDSNGLGGKTLLDTVIKHNFIQ